MTMGTKERFTTRLPGGSANTRVIGCEFGDGKTVLDVSTGTVFGVTPELPWNFTITKVRIIGDNAGGSAVVNVQVATYTNYPTMTNICASAKPTLTAALKNEDATLTGWTTLLSQGMAVKFILESTSLHKKVSVELTGTLS
ncbi:MAG: hypothetical protein V7638_3810 [Acidobacteriota bacterium]|jgi:hypothetical protein